MASSPNNANRVGVQTARMLEIYSLVAGELESQDGIEVSPEDRARFRHAIETIAGNMAELQASLACEQEDASPTDDREGSTRSSDLHALADQGTPMSLDDLVSAVLRWSVDSKAGE